MAAVSQTITASHAASIRSSFKSTANVTVAAVKWRRLVHKADPSGKPKSLADALKGSASSTPAVKPAVPNSSAALAATNALKSAIASAPQTTTPTLYVRRESNYLLNVVLLLLQCTQPQARRLPCRKPSCDTINHRPASRLPNPRQEVNES